MTGTLIVIILICGYLALAQAVNSLSENPGTFLLVDLVLAVMYLMFTGSVWLVYISFGREMMVIYAVLALMAVVMTVLFLRFCIRHSRSMESTPAILFGVYFLLVLYLTLFSRIGSADYSVREVAFKGLHQAIAERSLAPMGHFMLNVVLFLPFGYLIPKMNPDYLAGYGFAVIGGVVTSTYIEGIQLVLHLGQCDIDDIIANSIGAVIGYLFFWFVRRVQRNWRL